MSSSGARRIAAVSRRGLTARRYESLKRVILERVGCHPRIVVQVEVSATSCVRSVLEKDGRCALVSYVDRGNVGSVDGFSVLPLWSVNE
jgi:hypothetical protein